MAKTIMFDASIHLGQFCLTSEETRLGCKLSQISIGRQSLDSDAGLWTDNENGRVDNAIWALPRELQDDFYPFMDLFFSVSRINQVQLEQEDVNFAFKLMELDLQLSFLSAYTCSVAINRNISELHTLNADMLNQPLILHMQQHSLLIVRPTAKHETQYGDEQLESAYQGALTAFKKIGVNVLDRVEDPRHRLQSQ